MGLAYPSADVSSGNYRLDTQCGRAVPHKHHVTRTRKQMCLTHLAHDPSAIMGPFCLAACPPEPVIREHKCFPTSMYKVFRHSCRVNLRRRLVYKGVKNQLSLKQEHVLSRFRRKPRNASPSGRRCRSYVGSPAILGVADS